MLSADVSLRSYPNYEGVNLQISGGHYGGTSIDWFSCKAIALS